MDFLDKIISEFASFIWGLPLLILLIGGGFYLLILSKFLPFKFILHALNVLRGKYIQHKGWTLPETILEKKIYKIKLSIRKK